MLQFCVSCLSLRSGRPPGATLFPYMTLFRSRASSRDRSVRAQFLATAGLLGAVDEGQHQPGEAVEPLAALGKQVAEGAVRDRKSTRLNSSHLGISYAVFCLNKKNTISWTYNV